MRSASPPKRPTKTFLEELTLEALPPVDLANLLPLERLHTMEA